MKDNGAHGYTEGANYTTEEQYGTVSPKLKKEEIYLDLSKCTEDEQIKVISLLPETEYLEDYEVDDRHKYLRLFANCNWIVAHNTLGKTEITYPEFIKLFEGGESKEVLQVENYTREDMEKAYRAGEKGATYYFKDTTVILPTTYEGVDG